MKAAKAVKPKNNEEFLRACTEVNLPPTARQYRKWKAKKGLAYKVGRTLLRLKEHTGE